MVFLSAKYGQALEETQLTEQEAMQDVEDLPKLMCEFFKILYLH